MANASKSIWVEDDAIVESYETEPIDQVPLDDFESISYIIIVWDEARTVRKKLSMDIVKTDSGLEETVYDVLPGGIGFKVDPVVVASDMHLVFENEENYDMSIHFAKATFGDI